MVLTPDKDDSAQLIGFHAGGKLFGVNILTIREILRDSPIEPIKNTPPFIEGRIKVRGEVIPVIDLKKRLGKAGSVAREERNWVLIANVGDRNLAFLVDSVTRILKISLASILPAPDLIRSGMRSQYIKGVCNSEFGMLIVLDLNRMLGANEIKELKKLTFHRSL